MRQGFAVRRRLPPLLARYHQTFALQQLADGARRRPLPSWLVALQHALQFARSPAHVRLAQFQNLLLDLARGLVRMPLRRPLPFRQPSHSRLPVPPQPDIPGFPRYPEALAELRHGLLLALILEDKPQLLFHHTARFPWHALCCTRAGHRCQCQECARSVLSGMLPGYTVKSAPSPLPPGLMESTRYVGLGTKIFEFKRLKGKI